jgi:hypothetical protein
MIHTKIMTPRPTDRALVAFLAAVHASCYTTTEFAKDDLFVAIQKLDSDELNQWRYFVEMFVEIIKKAHSAPGVIKEGGTGLTQKQLELTSVFLQEARDFINSTEPDIELPRMSPRELAYEGKQLVF